MAEGGKMHSKLLSPLSLNINRQPKKPTIFRKPAVWKRKIDHGGKTKLGEHKKILKQEQCYEKRIIRKQQRGLRDKKIYTWLLGKNSIKKLEDKVEEISLRQSKKKKKKEKEKDRERKKGRRWKKGEWWEKWGKIWKKIEEEHMTNLQDLLSDEQKSRENRKYGREDIIKEIRKFPWAEEIPKSPV